MDEPVMVATEPEAPGNERPPEDPDDVDAAPAAVVKPRARARGSATAAVAMAER